MANTRGMPPADDWLVRRIKNLEHKVRMLEGARRLESATIGEDGITVTDDGSIKFTNSDDQLLLTLDGQNGLTATKLGRIGNANLAEPVVPGWQYADEDSTTLTVAGAEVCSATLDIPAGLTRAQVMIFGNVGNTRSSATAAPFYCQVGATVSDSENDSWHSSVISSTCAGSSSLSIANSASGLFTDLPVGGTIRFWAWAAVDDTSGWASGGANAHLNATVSWLR